MKRVSLKTFNNILAAIVIIISLYTLALPLLPQASFLIKTATGQAKLDDATIKTVPDGNRIMIRKIGVDVPINEGQDISALNSGSWRRPNTAKPNEQGNTVIVGHRFTYSGNDVFYHLDKVRQGDEIRIWWEGRSIDYLVESTGVVPADVVQIEASTEDKRLTLYTCTPLWSAKERLVIIAKPTGENQ